MKLLKPVLLLSSVLFVFYGCKKDNGSVKPLTHLAITAISPSSPTVDQAFTVTVEAKDENGQNQTMDGSSTITLSLASGNGTLSGDLTATMQGPDNIVRFTNVRYDKVESNVAIKATCTGGNSFTPGISNLFTVTGPMLIFKFKFDSTQTRLNSFGQVDTVLAPGHWGLCPKFNSMSAHYIELAPSATTLLGAGEVLYKAPELTSLVAPWLTAIDFDQSVRVGEGAVFFSMPLKNVTPGTYQWLRISLAYQNYDIRFRYTYSPYIWDMTGTVASFIGYNTHINSFKIKTQSLAVNDDKQQGFWAFEVTPPVGPVSVSSGQAPPGATTVPNPLNSTSPIPAGSCVVTGQFLTDTLTIAPLTIPAVATSDITVTVSVSTNKSFEWLDYNGNHVYEPALPDTERVTDMGVRGIIPIVQH
jgi:hypothetical protein